ncbi:MAG TPA: dihydrolipoyl dehydrogenase [Solirubrobacteraceae bacterium]|nr:dihydrolipoyl dehydrogenase [Solirubrobacteraceae bacterium]
MIEIRVPDIGDFTDVPVIEIHVKPGDEVAVEDPLVTLESDKATMDVPAPAAGTVKQLAVQLGDRVSEGSILLTLDQVEDEAVGASETVTRAPSPVPTEAAGSALVTESEGPTAAAAQEYGFDLAVLGAGVGGYTAAFRAADLGLRVALIERYDRLGGVCLNVGCIPSKALLHAARVVAEAEEMAERGVSFGKPKIDLEALVAWKRSVVDKLTGGLAGLAKQRKVEVIHGGAAFTGPHTIAIGDRNVSFAHAIIAAGSQAATLPFLPDDPRIIDSTDALSPPDVPRRLLVIGGGIIGLELATVYDALGSRVTVVELLDQLIPGCDADLVAPLHKRIERRYESILLGTSVTEVKAQKSGLKVTLSSEESAVFDRILVAVGRRPNGHRVGAEAAGVAVDEAGFIAVDRQLRTNVPWIHAIGDIVAGPMLAHKASHEGKVAAEVIAGQNVEFDPRAIPSVAYTDPEVAWMGLTEAAAKERGVGYEKAVFPWAASGRALGLGRDDGFTKLLVEPGSRRLLGAGLVGVNAGELIAETVLALEMGADAEDIGLTVHPHPTLTETVAFAAELAAGTVTDLPPSRAAPSCTGTSPTE